MQPIVIEVEGLVAAPVETVYDVFRPIDLTTIMLGYGPLPAVSALERAAAQALEAHRSATTTRRAVVSGAGG